MRKLWSLGILLAGVAGFAPAQMHKVAKPETVVRAMGVYEWTGDLAKPAASRLIPITLYIDKKLEDAGLYLARPVPFALQSGTVYELEQAGVPKGTLALVYARHLQATNIAQEYDDGWFGYGSFKGLAVPKKQAGRKLPPARTVGIETASGVVDPDRPHFVNRAGQPVTPGSAGTAGNAPEDKTQAGKTGDVPAEDPDRPHFSRKDEAPVTGAGDAKADGSGTTPANDPDRPTMKRRSGNDTGSTTASAGTDVGTMPQDDPDRPTLKRHPAQDAENKAKEPEASVTGTASLNDDPNRPILHRGKPTSALTEADLPKLSGLPVDLQQMVAISDAVNRPVHDFSRPWEDDAERAAILEKLQAQAQAQLAAYGGAAPPATPVAPVARRHAPNSKLRRPIKPLQVAMVPLQDEQLKGYLLSYGDVPTFVYQAHTDGDGASLRYVTIVAQLDAQHQPKIVLHTVTDAAHLDRAGRMKLVDAVDVDASNRAALLFEVRGQTSRQFAVFRVLGLQATQIFSTGGIP